MIVSVFMTYRTTPGYQKTEDTQFTEQSISFPKFFLHIQLTQKLNFLLAERKLLQLNLKLKLAGC